MTSKPNNVISIPCSLDKTFFRLWMEFLLPYHHMTSREMDVAAGFLQKWYELSKCITDDDIINRMLFSVETKREIQIETGMEYKNMAVVISNLKSRNFIIKASDRKDHDKLNPRFIPRISDDKNHKLLILFNFDDSRSSSKRDSE